MCFHHDCSTLWVKVCVVPPQENVKFSLLFLRVIFRHKIIFQLLPLNKKMLRSWKMESNFVIKVHTCNEVWADYQTSLRITQVFSTPPKTTACLMKLWQGGGTLQPIIKTVKYIYLWTFIKEFTTKSQIMEWVTTRAARFGSFWGSLFFGLIGS